VIVVYELTEEMLLPYCNGNGSSLAHVRIFQRGLNHIPVVVIGEPSDLTGPSVPTSLEAIASSVQEQLFPDGRWWRFIHYSTWPGQHYSESVPEFTEVTFASRHKMTRWRRLLAGESAGAWNFSAPQWRWNEPYPLVWPDNGAEYLMHRGDPDCMQLILPGVVRVPLLLGDTLVTVWPADAYTTTALAGPGAAALKAEVLNPANRLGLPPGADVYSISAQR
jgi:hypothetical protein